MSADNLGVTMNEQGEVHPGTAAHPHTDPSGSWIKRAFELALQDAVVELERECEGAGVMSPGVAVGHRPRRASDEGLALEDDDNAPRPSRPRAQKPERVQAAAVPGARVRHRKPRGDERRQKPAGDTCFVIEQDKIPHARVSFTPRRRLCRFRSASRHS